MLSAQELLGLPIQALNDDCNPTATSIEERQVEDDIRQVLEGTDSMGGSDDHPKVRLHKRAHMAFIHKLLAKPLPAAYVAFDATRPWLLYWSLHAWVLMNQEPLNDQIRKRAVTTLLSCQNKDIGGFGGGPGQIPHLMATYAAINALCIAGRGPQDWDSIDRRKLYAWMLRLKQPDGSFTVHEGGEVDVRASYCVWCIATLTGVATVELLQGTRGFLASCQSYEGGLASTSYPTYTDSLQLDINAERPALGEAHGGYAFCATAAYLGLSLLSDRNYDAKMSSSSDESSKETLDDLLDSRHQQKRLDLRKLTRWTVGLQCPFPSQGGGYKGRINKLVDGCYSWFSGSGMWGVLESLRTLEQEQDVATAGSASATAKEELWDRRALQLYILLVAQDQALDKGGSGGLRDKPGKKADAYHTCYNLAGLSGAQHIVRPCKVTRKFCYDAWSQSQTQGASQAPTSAQDRDEELRRRIFSSSLGFNLAMGRDKVVVGEDQQGMAGNEVLPTHPVLNVGFVQVREMMLWAYGQTLGA
ncbi:unnamed protein product [Jaminaea pallidilutea]